MSAYEASKRRTRSVRLLGVGSDRPALLMSFLRGLWSSITGPRAVEVIVASPRWVWAHVEPLQTALTTSPTARTGQKSLHPSSQTHSRANCPFAGSPTPLSRDTVNLMVDQSALTDVYSALASETRRTILHRLAAQPAAISELSEGFGFTKQAMTKHVRILERAGVVTRELDGRCHVLRLDEAPLEAAMTWLQQTRQRWDTTFDALEEHLR